MTDERGTPFVLRLFFVVALVFTTIGIVESAFIVFDLFTGTFSSGRSPDLSFGVRSWTLHHELRPGYSNPAVHTNSFGLRSPEVAVPKPAGTFRILILGDSFTFGFGVADDKVFARRLEAQLRGREPDASIEVVNAGVLLYCPLLEYPAYRHRLHALEPDLVILNFDMSDVQDHMAYSRDTVFSSDGLPLFVTEPTLRDQTASAMPGLLSFEWIARHLRGARGRVQSTLEGVPFVRDEDRYLWAMDGGPDMENEARSAMAPIADLKRLLQHDGIPLLLATYPQPWQVSVDATPLPPIRDQYGVGRNRVHLNDRSFRTLEKFAAENAIPFANATPMFRQDPKPAGLFLSSDFHFTPRGHDLYADVLARALVEKGLLAVP